MKKFLSLFLVIALSLTVLSGCSKKEDVSKKSSKSETTSESKSSDKIVFNDVIGEKVVLEEPATRLVGTHNPTMNIAIILGGGGKYIAGFGNKGMANNLYDYVYKDFDNVPQIGSGKDINYESVLDVKADFAILPERFSDQKEKFNEIGVNSAVVLPNTESFETIKSSLTMVGKIVGEENKAKKINSFFDKKVENAKKVAKKSKKDTKAIFLGGSSQLSVANGKMLQSTLLETVGATNVAKNVDGEGDYVDVSLEEIIKWNPEVIYIPKFAKYSVEDILNDPAWESIDAVKNKKVFSFPSKLEPWDYPTPSISMGLGWLLNNLYPNEYSMDNVLKDANEYYKMVYNKTFTAEELGLK